MDSLVMKEAQVVRVGRNTLPRPVGAVDGVGSGGGVGAVYVVGAVGGTGAGAGAGGKLGAKRVALACGCTECCGGCQW